MKKFAIYILIICWALSAKAFLPGKYGWNEPRNCRDINSPADEFAPVWNDTDASLIFNSDREGVSKFYTAAPDSFCFTGIHALGRLLNAPAQNRSYMSFLNPDEAYISAFRMAGGRAQLNIFRTIRQKGMWSRPMLVEDLASDYFTAHPAISPDGNLIIFSSTRDSEYGDSDLWMARRLDDVSWDIPVRLDEISSPGDDITPFLASGDTLYFASNGHKGPGGFDIFMSVLSGGAWQRPIPISELNTVFDESDFVELPDGRAMFASNRPGGEGGLDLYITSRTRPSIEHVRRSEIDLTISTLVRQINYFEFEKSSILLPPQYILISNNESLSGKMRVRSDFHAAGSHRLEDYIDEMPALVSIAAESVSRIALHPVGNSQDSDYQEIESAERISTESGFEAEDVYLISADSDVFRKMYEIYDSTAITPPMLEVALDARPAEDISEWNFSLRMGDTIRVVKIGAELPARTLIGLDQFAPHIAKIDSLEALFRATDNAGGRHSQSVTLGITHTSISRPAIELIEGKVFFKKMMLVGHQSHWPYLNSYQDYIRKNIVGRRNMIIRYFDESGRAVAEIIRDFAAGLSPDTKIVIKKNESRPTDLKAGPGYLPNLFSILISKN